MSVRKRALIIGLLGPATQAAGVAWEAGHLVSVHLHDALTPRHIVFEPGFLLIILGLLVTIVCVPVAIEVAASSEEDVAVPALGSGDEEAADQDHRLLGQGR